MGIMSFLRNRAGIIIILAIGFAIIAFLAGDVIKYGGPSWNGNQSEVGKVAGESIDIQDFNKKVEANTANFRQQMGGTLNPQMTAYVIENTWNQAVSQILMEKEIRRLDLQVTGNELMNDMVLGKTPDPQIVQYFGDPKTGQVDRTKLNEFLVNVKNQDPNSEMRQQWVAFLASLRQNRLTQKYNSLVKNSLYVTSLEAKEDHNQRNKLANFKYVLLDFASLPDGEVKLTEEDYKSYYNENKFRYKITEEARTFEYITFDANPSKSDSLEVKSKVYKLVAEFRDTINDSLFVSINSDSKSPISYVSKGKLDPSLDSLVFSASAGQIVGPVFSNGSYKFAKILDIKVGPDSVKASHILINPTTEGGIDKAKAKADSIRNLILKGGSFAELATKFGTDGSKDKNGELGTFARGAMVPAFEDAVFNGKTGDLKVITTQFGVHVIKINDQIGSSRVAKVAVIDKALVSSNKTQQEAYSKATSFLSVADNSKKFDEQIKQSGYNKLLAENIPASQSTIPGVESPREIIRWAFKADVGDVSNQVFEADNKFVIAKLTDIRKVGTLPLDKVKIEIEPIVRKEVKAKMLADKMEKAIAGSSTIEQVGQKLRKPVMPVQNIVFANPIIPGTGQENKLVGAIFGSPIRKVSKTIKGESGVYVFSVESFTNPAPLTNAFKQKEQIAQNIIQRASNETFKALKEKAEIKDNRVKFF